MTDRQAFKKITTLEQVDALDEELLVAGYRAGLSSQPDYTHKDQAYWHGYMNGQCDRGLMPLSEEQRELARNASKALWERIAAGLSDKH